MWTWLIQLNIEGRWRDQVEVHGDRLEAIHAATMWQHAYASHNGERAAVRVLRNNIVVEEYD